MSGRRAAAGSEEGRSPLGFAPVASLVRPAPVPRARAAWRPPTRACSAAAGCRLAQHGGELPRPTLRPGQGRHALARGAAGGQRWRQRVDWRRGRGPAAERAGRADWRLRDSGWRQRGCLRSNARQGARGHERARAGGASGGRGGPAQERAHRDSRGARRQDVRAAGSARRPRLAWSGRGKRMQRAQGRAPLCWARARLALPSLLAAAGSGPATAPVLLRSSFTRGIYAASPGTSSACLLPAQLQPDARAARRARPPPNCAVTWMSSSSSRWPPSPRSCRS